MYVVIAVAVLRRLPPAAARARRPPTIATVARKPLAQSRGTVLELAALFSLDAGASGFVVQSLLVLWLHLEWGLSPGVTAAVFFAVGLLSAFSQLLAGPLARRIGLVRTMVFTHLPANLFLVLAAFAPSAGIAIGCLLVRALFSQMDVPARQALVMAVVTPGGTRRGRERHQRPAQPGVGGDAAPRRRAAEGDHVRLAADHRRARARRPTTWCCSPGSAAGRRAGAPPTSAAA